MIESKMIVKQNKLEPIKFNGILFQFYHRPNLRRHQKVYYSTSVRIPQLPFPPYRRECHYRSSQLRTWRDRKWFLYWNELVVFVADY